MIRRRLEQQDWGSGGMQLTAQIKEATNGWRSLTVHDMPTLVIPSRNVEEIPEVVKTAVAELLGCILTLASGIRRGRLQGFRWRQLT